MILLLWNTPQMVKVSRSFMLMQHKDGFQLVMMLLLMCLLKEMMKEYLVLVMLAPSSAQNVTNLVSNTGVVGTDVTGVGTARWYLTACEYGGDKGIFGYGNTLVLLE